MPDQLAEGYDVFLVREGYGRPITSCPTAKCEPGFIIKLVRWKTIKGQKNSVATQMFYNDGQGQPTERGSVPFMTEGAARRAARTLKLGGRICWH